MSVKTKEDQATTPTSFRLSKGALEALEKASKLYRLSRADFIEFMAKAAAIPGHSELGTEMAKMEIDTTVVK